MKESWPPQSQRFNMRSPRKRTWFCSTSIVAPRRAVKEAGLFELGQIEAGILGERRVGDRQDEGAHRGFPTSRRTHEQDLAAISGDYNGAQRRPTFFFIVLAESVFGHYPFGHLHFGHWTCDKTLLNGSSLPGQIPQSRQRDKAIGIQPPSNYSTLMGQSQYRWDSVCNFDTSRNIC